MRIIQYTVSETGVVSPATKQWGGVQHEHNATEIMFDYTALEKKYPGAMWRIDFDSSEAGFDPGGTVFPVAYTAEIRRQIPQKFTQCGGEMTAVLVGSEVSPDGSETVRVVCSIPVTLYFAESERHEQTEGEVAESLSQMERHVLDVAEKAENNISKSEKNALDTVAGIQEQLDNGDFVGPVGPQGPSGPRGDDYVLTEADKDEIAEKAAEKVDVNGKADTSAVANSVKTTARGTNILINDISPLKHNIALKVEAPMLFETTNFGYLRSTPFVLTEGNYAISIEVTDQNKWHEWVLTDSSWVANASPQWHGNDLSATFSTATKEYCLFLGTRNGLTPEDVVSCTIVNTTTGGTAFPIETDLSSITVNVVDDNGTVTLYKPNPNGTVEGVVSTYPTMSITNSIGAEMVCEYNRDLNKAIPIVDQTYTPESTNAQSGKAVAEAQNFKQLFDTVTVTQEAFDEAGESGITVLTIGSDEVDLTPYNEIAIEVEIPDSSTINTANDMICVFMTSTSAFLLGDANILLRPQSNTISKNTEVNIHYNRLIVKGFWLKDKFLYGQITHNGYRQSAGYPDAIDGWTAQNKEFIKSHKHYFHVQTYKKTFKFPAGTTINVYGR
jgi:hypothetical protein